MAGEYQGEGTSEEKWRTLKGADDMALSKEESTILLDKCQLEVISIQHNATQLDKENLTDVTIETKQNPILLYNVTDHPPIALSALSGMQHVLLSISSCLVMSLLVADVTCAENNEAIKTKLLSSTFLMCGLTTIMMSLVGIGLPLFQGPAGDYLVPLLTMKYLNPDMCSIQVDVNHPASNQTNGNATLFNVSGVLSQEEFILNNLRDLQGSLIAAGAVQFLLGVTGLAGVLLRFIGPITVVPTIFLGIVFLVRATTKFAMVHWGISIMVAVIGIILSIYLAHRKCPIPFWTRRKGFHIIFYPIHQVFSLLIAIVSGWIVSGILTHFEVIPDDPNSRSYLARTDAKTYIIRETPWLNIPYPGQFGPIRFSISVFVGFFIGTITSVLDSIGDYYACANICNAPPPPSHGVNRGILVEGLMSMMSGFVGVGHATTTFGGNIGAIGVTRVASRDALVSTGVIYIVFGVIGKVSAVFLTIPYPVLGGALLVLFGMFTGVVFSNLKEVSLTSSRNLAIIGLSIFFGLTIPLWVENNQEQISVGSDMADNILRMILGNPGIPGGLLACFMDNTVPGNIQERGIAAWQQTMKTSEQTKHNGDKSDIEDGHRSKLGYEVYEPFLVKLLASLSFAKRLPFMPKK